MSRMVSRSSCLFRETRNAVRFRSGPATVTGDPCSGVPEGTRGVDDTPHAIAFEGEGEKALLGTGSGSQETIPETNTFAEKGWPAGILFRSPPPCFFPHSVENEHEGLPRRREISVRRNVLGLFSSIALLFMSLHAWAQQAPELNEIVVTATRIDSPILESPSAVSVISSADIAASGAHDLAAVIADQTALAVNDYGPQGSTKSVSLRGSTSSQVLVLLDGTRLNSSRDGLVDFSLVPMDNIDRVEIVRGGASTLYGTGAIGGVINIITKKPTGPAINLSVTNASYIPHVGNEVVEVLQAFPLPPLYPQTPVAANLADLFDSQNIALAMAGRLGDIGLTGGGAFGRAGNAFTWYDATHLNTWRRRTNADTISGSAFAGLTAPFLGGEAAVKGTFEISDTASPGSLTLISATARQGDTAASGSLSWKTNRFLVDALTFDLKAFYRHDQLTYNDPTYPPKSVHTTNSALLDLTQKLTLTDALAVVYGGSGAFDSVESTNYSAPQQRLNVAGFLSVPISLSDRLIVTPSARYDYFSDFTGSLSYSLSGVYMVSDSASLRASAASAYRVPTLNDLYWYDPFGYTAANPNLKPETSFEGNVGFSTEDARLSLDVSLFTRYVENNIVWLASSPLFVYMPQNLTKTLFPGAEIHAKVKLTETLSLEASYTFLYSLLLNDGTVELTAGDDRRVPYTPLHSLSMQVRYATDSVELGFTERYVSKQYTDSTNATAMDGYFVADASSRFSISESTAITLAAKNVFSTLYYTQLGYPMPPFSLEAGMQLHL
jgi:vitamin B12 transporter